MRSLASEILLYAVAACLVLLACLTFAGCGPEGPEIVDGRDLAAMRECYTPRYLHGGPELSCSTECDRPSVCASVCSQSRADCPTGDGLDDRAGACDRAAAQAARGLGLRVPSWPMVRCD